MKYFNVLRKVTGVIGFVVFIWCFGAIFAGANDPVFGRGIVQLGGVGILAVVPYIVTAFAQNAILRKHHTRIEAMIFANRLSDAETALREVGTQLSNGSMQGTLMGLKLLSVVLDKQGRCVDALKILKVIAKQCPDVRGRLVELEGRAAASTPAGAHEPGGR